MVFNSTVFIIFFLLVVVGYFAIPKKVQNMFLLISSYLFYGFADPKFVFLLVGITVSTYICSRFLSKGKKSKQVWKFIGISIPVLLLIIFKYLSPTLNFISSNINGFNVYTNIILPAGISFYSFQAISYIVDVDKGRIDCERNYLTLSLYLSFFPQLVAGPIERAQNLLPQLKSERKFNPESAICGAKLMLLGFAEKIAIADILGKYVDSIYNNLNTASSAEVLLVSFLFSIQILCDFKGYSDIAVGSAKILGINLSNNFDHPYSAFSIKDFWRRWHISLSSWFKDYLYIPLGGNKKGTIVWIRNIIIVFALSGLWHGANLTFVAWGLMHAIFQIAEHFIFKTDKPSLIRRLFTFLSVNFAWILFRASSLSQAGLYFSKLFTAWGSSMSLINWIDISIIAAASLLFILVSTERITSVINKCKTVKYGLYIILTLITITAYIYSRSSGIVSNFIYFQF